MERRKRYVPLVLAVFLRSEVVRLASAGQQPSKRALEFRLLLIGGMAGALLAMLLPPRDDIYVGALGVMACSLALNASILWERRRSGGSLLRTRRDRRERMAELARIQLPEDES